MAKQNKIGLGMIVKADASEAAPLERCLASVASSVDEIHVTVTGQNAECEAVALKYGATVSHFTWIDDFAAARNFNLHQIQSDWYLWLDADDTLLHPERLRDLVRAAEETRVGGYYFYYQYQFDENGHCIDAHWKPQLLKNDGSWDWKGAIHEDALPLRPVQWTKTELCTRVHHTEGHRQKESFERNLRILLKERERDKNEPRTLFYLGRTYFALGEFQKALDALTEYLTLSGWPEERYEARLLMGDAFMNTQQFDEAIRMYNDAILEMEEYGEAYVRKANAYMMQKEWNKALYNLKTALGMQEQTGDVSYNPMKMKRDVWIAIGMCYTQLGKLDDGLRAVNTALKADPKDKNARELQELVQFLRTKHKLANNYFDIAKALRDNKQEAKIVPLLHSVPREISDHELILGLRHTYFPPKVWPKKSVAVYCGSSAEVWRPGDENGKGIGGSETAVIELSKRLVKYGWSVTVFNNCDAPPDGFTVDGVHYENYWKFNWQDTFDVLWVWRLPELFDYEVKGRLRILDLHDVMNPADFPPERVARMDKIFVKTNYHRSLYPKVANEKFVVVGNGIDLKRFDAKEKRQAHRFIYSSSPNRGLDIVLKLWPQLKAKFPDAELHTYYGWNTFYEIEKHNPERMTWMRKIQAQLNQPGVVSHERVGQKELAREMMKSSYWLYPTYFPEIHCITACEMQAAGVIPLTTGFAALAETQKVGLKLKGDMHSPQWQQEYVDKVIAWVEDKDGTSAASREAQEAAKQFSWDNVANEWNQHLQ